MTGLECVLHVPVDYPRAARPSLDVKNEEMGRGYQINVERGFDALVAAFPQSTLLKLLNALDRQLEALLTEQKAETVKIMPNAGVAAQRQSVEARAPLGGIKATPAKSEKLQAVEAYTVEQKIDAAARRGAETRQLEARLGRMPLYSWSVGGMVYTLPIEPRKRGDLPVALQAVTIVKLHVPALYPLQSCRIDLQEVAREAALPTERAFERKAKESPATTLMGHVNYLAQNMHIFAKEAANEQRSDAIDATDMASRRTDDLPTEIGAISRGVKISNEEGDRSHVKFIPRPPEWALDWKDADDGSDSSGSDESADEFTDEESGHELGDPAQASPTLPERGILLSFPYLELHGIELLELVSLNMTIKCNRCKEQTDIQSLRHNAHTDTQAGRVEYCKKCAYSLKIGSSGRDEHLRSILTGDIMG